MEISTHAPRAGSDTHCAVSWMTHSNFNPRSPCGERRRDFIPLYTACRNFNPRSPCGERQCSLGFASQQCISTHAPRAGSDHFCSLLSQMIVISTHAPRAGSDALAVISVLLGLEFQPTLPVRGATAGSCQPFYLLNISTHAPRAGSDVVTRDDGVNISQISTHAPRAGSDTSVRLLCKCQFISTHAPRAGSDAFYAPAIETRKISTHAPRAGSDLMSALVHPAADRISTHAPRAGSDVNVGPSSARRAHFNPRSPCGERQTNQNLS